MAAGTLFMFAGLFLPLWHGKHAIITGWDGNYFSGGVWVVLGACLLAVLWMLLPWLRRGRWMQIVAGIAMIQSLLVLWRGYKLHAIGLGAWFLLLGAGLMFMGSIWNDAPAGEKPGFVD